MRKSGSKSNCFFHICKQKFGVVKNPIDPKNHFRMNPIWPLTDDDAFEGIPEERAIEFVKGKVPL